MSYEEDTNKMFLKKKVFCFHYLGMIHCLPYPIFTPFFSKIPTTLLLPCPQKERLAYKIDGADHVKFERNPVKVLKAMNNLPL